MAGWLRWGGCGHGLMDLTEDKSGERAELLAQLLPVYLSDASSALAWAAASCPALLPAGCVTLQRPCPFCRPQTALRRLRVPWWWQVGDEVNFFFIFKILFLRFIYLFTRDTETGRDTGRGRSRLHAGSPYVGLDPRTPGSRPGPKAGAKPLSQPGIPSSCFLQPSPPGSFPPSGLCFRSYCLLRSSVFPCVCGNAEWGEILVPGGSTLQKPLPVTVFWVVCALCLGCGFSFLEETSSVELSAP